MPLSEKEVFYYLLHNHQTNLKTLCAKTEMPYAKMSKRIARGSLLNLPTADAAKLCKGLGVSYEELTALLVQAKNGGFSDDYPKEQIKLNVVDRACLEERVIPMMLTPDEKELIELHRASIQKALARQTPKTYSP